MSPFRHGSRWWVQVPTSDRRWRRVSTGTSDKATARQMAEMLSLLHSKRDWPILDAIAQRRRSLAEVWDDYRVDQTLAGTRELLDDVDLSPMVDEWDGKGKRGGKSPKYVAQVRRFIPKGVPFPKSRFTAAAITRFLDGLALDPSTKMRYRAALQQFGRWLAQRKVIAANPVRKDDVDSYTKPDAPPVFLELHQVQALVWRLPEPFRALEALMAGSGMEWSTIERLTRRDIDLEARIVYARGTKNKYRTRYLEVSEDWAWQLVRAHAVKLAPEMRVFPVKHEEALLAHHAAAAELELPRTTLHHHRHSFAVMHIRRRTDHQWIKRQLGHAPNSTLLYTVYGVYIDEAEMRARAAERAAKAPKSKRGAGAKRRSAGGQK